MSLPACQERILTRIETALRIGEPRLASRFAIFTRLTRDEELPRREQIAPQSWLKRVASACRPSPRAWGRVSAGFRMAVLLPLVLAAMTSAVIAASVSSSHTCAAAHGRAMVATGRWNFCTVTGAPPHGTRTAGAPTQGTPR